MKRIAMIPVLLVLLLSVTVPSFALWNGVDETVVEKYAEDHGRAARDPYINTDQGDLLLFLFLLGGAVAGFAGGYYWRTLTEKKVKVPEKGDGHAGGGQA